MKKSEIKFVVELDDKNIPERIMWEATDGPSDRLQETHCISVSLWDHVQINTMRIDLWTKEMPVLEMKKFVIETLGGISESVVSSTGDQVMSDKIKKLCKELYDHVEETHKNDQ